MDQEKETREENLERFVKSFIWHTNTKQLMNSHGHLEPTEVRALRKAAREALVKEINENSNE